MANSITRTYTFSNGGVADGGQVDSEIAGIVNTINNADAGITAWTVVKTATLTSTGTTTLKGTTTNDSAAAGNVGEYIESVVTNTSFPGTGTPGNLTSIALTAGDWDVSAVFDMGRNGATWTDINVAIGATSASFTGTTVGSSRFDNSGTFGAIFDSMDGAIPSFRVSLSGSATYYMVVQASFSVATPTIRGRLSARRVR